MEEKTDKVNRKHSTAHAPSPGSKRTDNMTNAGHVTYYSVRGVSDSIMTLSEERNL